MAKPSKTGSKRLCIDKKRQETLESLPKELKSVIFCYLTKRRAAALVSKAFRKIILEEVGFTKVQVKNQERAKWVAAHRGLSQRSEIVCACDVDDDCVKILAGT